MSEQSIYRDIAERTGGDIYIGVVGPVRSGKSTFIKRFMESLVLPNIEDGYERDRARDEMPQSAAGKTVMTTEPKFIPDEAVEIKLSDSASSLKVKMETLNLTLRTYLAEMVVTGVYSSLIILMKM